MQFNKPFEFYKKKRKFLNQDLSQSKKKRKRKQKMVRLTFDQASHVW